ARMAAVVMADGSHSAAPPCRNGAASPPNTYPCQPRGFPRRGAGQQRLWVGAGVPAGMIRCEDVHKTFTQGGRRVEALRGATLATPGPGFYAIMGQSGSGKTTLLHLLAAMDRPDSGLIEVAGEDVGALSERAATLYRRKRIGVVFQQYNLIPTL